MSDNRVSFYGTMKDTTVINLPEEWKGNVDLENISVSLTPIGTYQELYVESIKWGKQVVVKSQSGGPINAYYSVNTLLKSWLCLLNMIKMIIL